MFTKELSLYEIRFGDILFSDDRIELFPLNEEDNSHRAYKND